MMDELKKEMKALDEETSQMMSKLSGDENQNKGNETKQIEDFQSLRLKKIKMKFKQKYLSKKAMMS